MQKTIRILRVALPILFGLFLITIAVSWNRSGGARPRTTALPVTSTQRPTDKPQGESTAFEDTQTIGGRIVYRVRADRVVAFQSGWNTLEGVQITIYRANGQAYELSCPQAQYNSVTREAEAKGGVRVSSTDGMELATAQIHYDGRRLTNDIPVQFRIDRWEGRGGALELDVPEETVRLSKTITATLTAADPAQAPLTMEAAEGVFRRRANDVIFTRNVVMTRAADRLTSDRIAGRFTQDRKTLLGLEGNGNVLLALSSEAAQGENLGGPKQLFCDRFYTEVGPQGEINAIHAIGEKSMARALLEGPPKRDIRARTFRAALAGRAIKELKADWEVVMKELGASPREISADHATVSFDPVAHRAVSAFLEGSFKYRDAKNSASANRAQYDIDNDRILLTAEYGFDPTVVADGQTLKAKEIELSPKAGSARATGDVIAQLSSKQGGVSPEGTGIFPTSSKPVFVNADALILRQANRAASFNGNVRAWQDTNTLLAQELQVQGAGQTMQARGDVRTVLYNAGAETRKIPIRSRSDMLSVRRNERRVELTGDVKIEDEARLLTSETATLFFDAARKIERIEAERNVELLEKPTNRKGTGEKATYHVARRMAYLIGSPATANDASGSLSGQQIVFDLSRNRVQVLSPTGQTQGTYKPQ